MPFYPANVFEDIFNRVVYSTDAQSYARELESFDFGGPPGALIPYAVERAGEHWGLTSDVLIIMARYLRPSRVEWLSLHLHWMLTCAETDHRRWLVRQHRRLLPLS